jgi:drug/metabolite transporter (DMT)-like permease
VEIEKKHPAQGEVNIKTTLIVSLTVAVNLFAAWILDEAAGMGTTFGLISLAIIGLVIGLNIGRFALWGWIHKRINLAKSYPLTAMFFPLVALLSYFRGEVINPVQWLGIALITIGVVWFTLFVADN